MNNWDEDDIVDLSFSVAIAGAAVLYGTLALSIVAWFTISSKVMLGYICLVWLAVICDIMNEMLFNGHSLLKIMLIRSGLALVSAGHRLAS